MKGISFSINLIVILAITVLVLTAVGLFFMSNSAGAISEGEARSVFGVGCARYCKANLYETFRSAYLAAQNDPRFIQACTKLGYGDAQYPNRCLEHCDNCNTAVGQQDINSGLDNINVLTGGG